MSTTTHGADALETPQAGVEPEDVDRDLERVNMASERASGEKVVERVRQLMADESAAADSL